MGGLLSRVDSCLERSLFGDTKATHPEILSLRDEVTALTLDLRNIKRGCTHSLRKCACA